MGNRVALLTAGLRATGFPLHKAESMARRITRNGVGGFFGKVHRDPYPKVFCNKCRHMVPDYHEHWGQR